MDIASYQNSVLSINSILLPGGEHRRRNDADVLQMRSIFVPNDIISVPFLSPIPSRRKCSKSTVKARVICTPVLPNTARFVSSPLAHSQLSSGVLVSVPCVLIKRLNQHFVNLPCGVGCIIGNNGYIWVTDKLRRIRSNRRCSRRIR